MIREEHVSFETAKLLKEAGFPQRKATHMYDKGEFCTLIGFCDCDKWQVSAPTQALAMRWLREKMGIYVSILKQSIGWSCTLIPITFLCFQPEQSGFVAVGTHLGTYEEAAEAGIERACEYILEQKEV